MYMYVEKYKKNKDKMNTRTRPKIETIKAVQTKKNQTWLRKSKRKSKQYNRKKTYIEELQKTLKQKQ